MKEQEKKKGINEPDLINENKANFSYGKKKRCPNCKQMVEVRGDICPNCNHYIEEKRTVYQPINKKTAKIIRWILSGFLLAIFALLILLDVIHVPACSN